LFATDDITFPANSIMRAYQHIDSHERCGAVTFAHNKKRNEYRADLHPVRTDDERQIGYPYPQIALIRKWLGDKCDWWGANSGMKDAFTYGGDNWLGAKIIEYGYTVDVVKGAVNNELYIQDEPRRMNQRNHAKDAQIYFDHYPDWPLLVKEAQIPQQDHEELRVLFGAHWLNKKSKREKRALITAFERIGAVWEFDYFNQANCGEYLANAMDVFKPHLVFTQIHNQQTVTSQMVSNARRMSPDSVWINWVGDYWPDKVYRKNISLWRQFDALLCVNMDMLEEMSAYTATYPYLNTYEEPDESALPAIHDYDVVFLGNAYSKARWEVWDVLDSLRGKYKVGIFGKLYGKVAEQFRSIESDGVNHYDYAAGRAIYKKAKIAISTNEFGATGYTSNRYFEIIGSGGALCLHERTPQFGKYTDSKEGTHYIQWDNMADLKVKINHWLDPQRQKRRREIVRNAARHAKSKHNADARVKYILTDIVPKLLRKSKSNGRG
jgi:hypothetical protein